MRVGYSLTTFIDRAGLFVGDESFRFRAGCVRCPYPISNVTNEQKETLSQEVTSEWQNHTLL